MIDVFHLLAHGRPVIGGPLERWPKGPVVKPAYNRLKSMAFSWREKKVNPDSYHISQKTDTVFSYEPTLCVEKDDFSKSELEAMQSAWDCVIRRSHGNDNFFHDPATFVGLAWSRRRQGEPIAWADIIAAYDELHPGADHTHVKQLISA